MSKPMRYIGDGAFALNIPARDLSAAEVKELGGVTELRKTGLYETFPDEDVPAQAAETKTVATKEREDNAGN